MRGEYPSTWGEIAERVKSEAGRRCIRCSHPDGDRYIRPRTPEAPGIRRLVPCDERCTHPRDGKLRVLTVHHLNGDKENAAWWNLLALCQACHLSVQGRVIPERPWLFDHTPWFVPYVCGFYAWYYRGLDITREQADANPDLYLAMGQPWRRPA